MNEQLDPVHATLEELKSSPDRFQSTGGYDRLRALLAEGYPSRALEELLAQESSFVGDLLWTVCELEDVARYVEKAVLHLSAADPGTAGYAFEVLLRGARDSEYLQVGLNSLRSAPTSVREHAILVLASLGFGRAREVFELGSWSWAAELIDEIADGSRSAGATADTLVTDPRAERQFVGLLLAVVGSEQEECALRALEQSEAEWIRSFAGRLRRMFQHRWSAKLPPAPGRA